jgi:hypothetical protein
LLVDGFALPFHDAHMSLSMSAIQPKHREFVREVANGRAPEDVVKELYPKDNVAVALRRVQTPKVLAILEGLVSARWEKTVLLSRLSGIIDDERTKQRERITALRLGAQVSGYLNNMATYKPSRRQVKADDDAAMKAKLVELAAKAARPS